MAGSKKKPDLAVAPPLPKIPLLIKVVDGFGAAFAGAEVEVTNFPGKVKKRNTGTNGQVTFGLVSQTTVFNIKVRKAKFGPPATPFAVGDNTTNSVAKPTPIQLVLTQNVALFKVRVVNSLTKAALSGVSVTINVPTIPPPDVAPKPPFTTGGDGFSTRVLVPAGVAIPVTIQKNGFGAVATSGGFQLNSSTSAVQPPIPDGGNTNLSMQLQPGLHVVLYLQWKDPEGVQHLFPALFPVRISTNSGDLKGLVGNGGILQFDVDRTSQAAFFTLKFDTPDMFIGSRSPTSKDTRIERLLQAADVQAAADDGYRIWKLPKSWSLLESDWPTVADKHYNKTAFQFEKFDPNILTLGTTAAPVEMLLDPHWLYVRFEYFDRFFGHASHNHLRISVPPLMLDGFRTTNSTAGAVRNADTRSNWGVRVGNNTQQCQALPWVIQRKSDKSLDVKPDRDITLQLVIQPNSFVESKDATTRTLRNVTDKTELKPSPNRLKLYDLPVLWKSTRYFTRLIGGGGVVFENLINGQVINCVTLGNFLTFSLDDIVLMKAASPTSLSLTPVTLANTDQVAIFAHSFSQRLPNTSGDNPLLTREGVYKPDPATPWFSKNIPQLSTTNYISDYPDWTRLVVAQGNLFDVFDLRTPDSSQFAIGARAAVRWIDATKSPNFAPPRTNVNGALSIVQPRVVKTRFLTLQPFYTQHSRRGTEDGAPAEEQGGRLDLALIRCCDVDALGTPAEIGLVLNYFRFFFQPNPTISTANGNLGQVASGLSGAAFTSYVKSCMRRVPQRWNGSDPDDTPDIANPPGAAGANVGPAYGVTTVPLAVTPPNFNPARARIEPQTGPKNLRVAVMWFSQTFSTSTIVHFIVDIYQTCRAFMADDRGFGQLDATDDAPLLADNGVGVEPPVGGFVFAHENGHAASLADEYAEDASSAGYFSPGITYNTPGSPYLQDQNSIMCAFGTNVTPRYFWHIAEWMRFLDKNTIDYQVNHRGFTFKLPHLNPSAYQTNVAGAAPANKARPELYTHVNWPTNEHIVSSIGTRGRCTLFLYKLGDEDYNQTIVGTANGVNKGVMDGHLIIAVKIKFSVPTLIGAPPKLTDFNDIRNAISGIATNIDQAFNQSRCFVTGGTANGITYNRIRIRFVPRFLVREFTDDAANTYAQGLGFVIPTPPAVPSPSFAAQYRTLVNNITTNHLPDFRVTTRATASAWVATRRLRFQLASPVPANISFDSFFAEMLGVDPAQRFQPSTYNALIQQVIPGAAVGLIP